MMMRSLVVVGLFMLTLAGCAELPLLPPQFSREEQVLFNKGMDQFASTNQVDLLKQLRDDYPGTVWAERAETIILYAQELDKRKEQLTELRDEFKVLKQDNEKLHQETQQLTEKIEQLKGLLIEMENKPK